MDTYTEHQIRSFRPVILFHNDAQPSSSSSTANHSAQDVSHVVKHKQRITDMLKANSQIWSELIKSTRQWNSEASSSSLPPIHLPTFSSIGSMYDDQPIISPTASTSSLSSSSSSSSSTSTSSSSSITSPHPCHSPPYQKQPHWNPPSTFLASPDQYQLHMDTLCLDHLDKRRRGNLPKPVTAILKRWLLEHCRNPYPTEEEKRQLKAETQLTLNQISNWFINARRRTLPVILAKLNHHYPGIKARRRRRRQRQGK
ncbi:hypothetical protein [Absidia glauca]|uniref:Homeobox domain-containing protein n=1 Tax=Absidia glauca TaxID=4829 RepID=A0A170AQ52_ABSGL|nr:hypothetical protein [Absidia glauca]